MTYKQLFKNNPIIKQLAYVQFFGYFGSWFSNVAIYSMLVDFSADALTISLITAVHFLPAVLMAPFSGAIVDRINPKKLMIVLFLVEVAMTACFLLINSIDDVWMLFIFLFIRMSSASVIFTAMMSVVPKLVEKKAIIKANEIFSIIWSFTFVGGMAIGGFVVDIYGVKISFLIDMLFFILAILFLARVHFNIQPIKTTNKIIQSIKEGLIYIKDNKLIIHLIILHSSVGLTVFDALVTILADYHYRYIIAVPLAIGLSNASRAIALIIGSFVLTRWINNKNLIYLFIFQGISIILWSFFQNYFYISLFLMFIVGFAITTIWSFTYALLQENIKKEYMGRVLAYNEMMFMLTSVFTTIFIGIATSFISLFAITFILGFLMICFALYYKIIIYNKL